MNKERITKTRANYELLNKKLLMKKSFSCTREQLTKITQGYISDNPNYLRKKTAPLYKKASEYNYEIVIEPLKIKFVYKEID